MTESSLPPPPDERDRLRDKSQGPAPGLEEIWRDHGDQLRRRARTRLRQYGLSGHAESMDICNDVMADLTRRRVAAASPEQVLGYIFKAIDHQVIDTFRSLARQCRDFRRNESVPLGESPFPADDSSPSLVAIRREVVDQVRALVSPEDMRAIDMMLQNFDWVEIGDALGVKPDAARMRVQRALGQVRAKMVRDP